MSDSIPENLNPRDFVAMPLTDKLTKVILHSLDSPEMEELIFEHYIDNEFLYVPTKRDLTNSKLLTITLERAV